MPVEIRTWFARTAWNLGRIGNKESAYFRHHLFKLSSQFFALVGFEDYDQSQNNVFIVLNLKRSRVG